MIQRSGEQPANRHRHGVVTRIGPHRLWCGRLVVQRRRGPRPAFTQIEPVLEIGVRRSPFGVYGPGQCCAVARRARRRTADHGRGRSRGDDRADHGRRRRRGHGVVDGGGAGLAVLAGGGDPVGVGAGGGGVECAGAVRSVVGVLAGLDAGAVGVLGARERGGNVLAEVVGLAGLGGGDLGGGGPGDGVVDGGGVGLSVLAGGGDRVGVGAGGAGVKFARVVGGAARVGAGLDPRSVGVLGADEGGRDRLVQVVRLAALGGGDLGRRWFLVAGVLVRGRRGAGAAERYRP